MQIAPWALDEKKGSALQLGQGARIHKRVSLETAGVGGVKKEFKNSTKSSLPARATTFGHCGVFRKLF